MVELFKSKRRIAIMIFVLCILIGSGVLLTNALPKKSSYTKGNDSVIKPASSQATIMEAPDYSNSELKSIKQSDKIGGIQNINQEKDQPHPVVEYQGPGEYPKDYPKLTIISEGTTINWIRGDAFFGRDPLEIKGNSNFGADAKYAKSALQPIKLNPGALISFKADEVKGFAKPKYQVKIPAGNGDLLHYASNENSIIVPCATGTYLFQLSILWANESNPVLPNDNFIDYWFLVSVDNGGDESVDENEAIMETYIADFLTKGYSKYYIINSITSKMQNKKISGNNLEAIFITTMNSNVPLKDPDTVEYIIKVKEKAQKETDPEIKKMLQNEYETLKNEYGKPNDTNFIFKLTAKILDNKIDKSTIQLYLECGSTPNQAPAYLPAETLFIKN